MKTIELAKYGPVIPVIVIDSINDAVPVAESLLAGGIKVLEITLRSDCALNAGVDPNGWDRLLYEQFDF